jgi:hypothetical protein
VPARAAKVLTKSSVLHLDIILVLYNFLYLGALKPGGLEFELRYLQHSGQSLMTTWDPNRQHADADETPALWESMRRDQCPRLNPTPSKLCPTLCTHSPFVRKPPLRSISGRLWLRSGPGLGRNSTRLMGSPGRKQESIPRSNGFLVHPGQAPLGLWGESN